MVASPSTEAAGPSGSDNLVQDSHSMDGIVDGPGVEPELPSSSIWTTDHEPVERQNYTRREEFLQDMFSLANSNIMRTMKMKAKAQEGHKRDVDGLRQELFDLTKKAAESRQKENWGDDSEDGEPSGSKEPGSKSAEAQERERKQSEDREAAGQLRKQKVNGRAAIHHRPDMSTKFIPSNLSQVVLSLTVEVVLVRAEIALIRGKWAAMEEHGRYAGTLASQLGFEPLTARCEFYKGVAYSQVNCNGSQPTPPPR